MEQKTRNSLITVDAKIKVKGFKNTNLGIVAATKEDTQINQRIIH